MPKMEKDVQFAPVSGAIKHCDVCDETLLFSWLDQGRSVGACLTCGAPFEVYPPEGATHADGKWPRCLIRPEWIGPTRIYWTSVRSNVSPSYGIAAERRVQNDVLRLKHWLEDTKDALPKDYFLWARDTDGRF